MLGGRGEMEFREFVRVEEDECGQLTGGLMGKEPEMNVETRLDFPTPSSPTTTMRTGFFGSESTIPPRSLVDAADTKSVTSLIESESFPPREKKSDPQGHAGEVLWGRERVDGDLVQGRASVRSKVFLPVAQRSLAIADLQAPS